MFETDDKRIQVQQRLEQFVQEQYFNETEYTFFVDFLKNMVGNIDEKKADVARQHIQWKIDDDYSYYVHKYQAKCKGIIPGLRAIPIWDKNEFKWIETLEQNYNILKDELLKMVALGKFVPNKVGAQEGDFNKAEDGIGQKFHEKGKWNIFFIFDSTGVFQENEQYVPKSVQLISKLVPNHRSWALFSAMSPGGYIKPHNGDETKRLRLILPLIGIDGSSMRVGDEFIYFKEGNAIVFDDSFEHEAWHNGSETRVHLLMDLWHPDFSEEEIQFFSMLDESIRRHYESEIWKHDPVANSKKVYAIMKEKKADDGWWVTNNQSQFNQSCF
ncbi:aspartyl asparaginyl beta-hydroxylase [Stylonychia lemnae]|uniref:Aspartyl asparaginyl beta-hydroxylase n=1 Tax=Stylonychia lemnae TaxID=5949 RepID=A0A078A6G4_STYLE|nr:aspartyl asparaginyl beta-hydroxylase [Stylonychia lemnae]|eukprot:CDW77855.1 aspartyl asparaginyl beta-hydroxylase [Stylonychia lemnae]